MTKKREEKHDPATVTINAQEFRQSRDQFLSSFSVLKDAFGDLMHNYAKHTSRVLGEEVPNLDTVLKELNNTVGNTIARSPSADKNVPEKKKKRAHDPNAPKRPLTPFFLYMQTAREIIRSDLGPDAKKGAVSDEGTRRWGVMNAYDRQQWADAYQDNLKLYQARMHAYKAGDLDAKNMSDDDARDYYEDRLATAGNHAADAQLASEALANELEADIDIDDEVDVDDLNGSADPDADGEDEDEEEPPVEVRIPTPPPPKTPKVKSSRKKAPAKTETPVAAAPPSPVVTAPQAPEPDKKRKRKTKAEMEKEKASAAGLVDSIEKEEPLVQTPAASRSSKPKKKKTKSDA